MDRNSLRPRRRGDGLLRRRLSYANVVSTLALLLVVGGGTAWAAHRYLITSTSQIKPGVLAALRGAHGKRGINGAAGATGASGVPGAIGATGGTGVQGVPGTAKAYTFVNRFTPTTLDPNRTKGFTALTNPGTGEYCLTPPPGVDPGHDPAVASLEYTNTALNNAVVLWVTQGGPCPAGSYLFVTFNPDGTTPNSSTSFSVIVP
jgi:hypothetical protein